MDKEVIEQARRHAAMLHSVGLPQAAAETEAAYPYFSGMKSHEPGYSDGAAAPVPAA